MLSHRLLIILVTLVGLVAVVGLLHVVIQSSGLGGQDPKGFRDFSNLDTPGYALNDFDTLRSSHFADKEQSYVISKPLGNETARALLGQSTWRLIHTTMARFPIRPTDNEKQALNQFIFLLSRLYPCGDCAQHFQQLLQELPPRISSRYEAEQWACEAHNRVNARLDKELLDCSIVSSLYDCGCKE
ncbi:hypothetical protein H4R35_003259 [Dimargaris xerosporica]|nr:hypothetical protein H4R35_003259 [Dimargaris xerosporica]